MDSKAFRKTAKLHKALGNERRLLILSTIRRAKQSFGYSVLDLAELLDLPYKSVSKHLQILEQSRFIERARNGKSVGYTSTKLTNKYLKTF